MDEGMARDIDATDMAVRDATMEHEHKPASTTITTRIMFREDGVVALYFEDVEDPILIRPDEPSHYEFWELFSGEAKGS